MTADAINEDVKELIDPGKKSRQRVARYLSNLDNTQLGGFRFVVVRTAKWSPNKYRLTRVGYDAATDVESDLYSATGSPRRTMPARTVGNPSTVAPNAAPLAI